MNYLHRRSKWQQKSSLAFDTSAAISERYGTLVMIIRLQLSIELKNMEMS